MREIQKYPLNVGGPYPKMQNRSEGAGRGSRYRLPLAEKAPEPAAELQPAVQLPVSDKGEAIRAAVRAHGSRKG
jgi:hypothetical protein